MASEDFIEKQFPIMDEFSRYVYLEFVAVRNIVKQSGTCTNMNIFILSQHKMVQKDRLHLSEYGQLRFY